MRRTAAMITAGMLLLAACSSSGGTATTSSGATSSSATTSSSAPSSSAPSTTAGTVTTAPTGGAPATVPARYQGRWNLRPADCATVSEGQLTIEAGRVEFYESSGPVTAVAPSGDTVTVTIQLTGEGSTRTDVRRFTVSADGQQLTDLTTGAVRFRCPS